MTPTVLPFKSADAFDFRKRHHIKCRHVGDAADEHEIGAAEHRIHDRRTAGKGDLGIAG